MEATPTCRGVGRSPVHPSGGQNSARGQHICAHARQRGAQAFEAVEEGMINPARKVGPGEVDWEFHSPWLQGQACPK